MDVPRVACTLMEVPVHDVTMEETISYISQWIAKGGTYQIATVNPEFLMEARKNNTFRAALCRAALCIPDGIGILAAARLRNVRLRERVAGSDLVPRLAAEAARQKWRIFFLGAAPGIADKAVEKLEEILLFEGNTTDKLNFLEQKLKGTHAGKTGLDEMKTVFSHLAKLDLWSTVEFDLTLARGLNYYTGAIFEVNADDVKIGSICGGGRYDDLTGIFGMPDISGVGVSFGADRIYDVMAELGLFPHDTGSTTQVFFVNFGENEQNYCLDLVVKLRKAGINAELYPEPAKMKKQMTYANNKNIPYVVLIGENEMNAGSFTVKNMESGEQSTYESLDRLIQNINP